MSTDERIAEIEALVPEYRKVRGSWPSLSLGRLLKAAAVHLSFLLNELELRTDQLTAAQAKIIRLRDALAKVEWIQTRDSEEVFCPQCGSYKSDGHIEGCDIAEALKEA